MEKIIYVTLTKEQKEHLAETTQMLRALTEVMADGEVILPEEEQKEFDNVIAAALNYYFES